MSKVNYQGHLSSKTSRKWHISGTAEASIELIFLERETFRDYVHVKRENVAE